MTPEDTPHVPAPLVNQCCVCGRQRVDDAWLALCEGGPCHGGAPERISHTYCPECLLSAPPHREATGRAFVYDLGRAFGPAR